MDCVDAIVPGLEMTKEWRHDTLSGGTFMGGATSMVAENWQICCIEKIVGFPCKKTNLRLNIDSAELRELSRPSDEIDEFEWTEDFDGRIILDKQYLLNFKMVVGTGGAQTRTLRELYHVIKCQFRYIKQNTTSNIVFVNILDGDCAAKKMHRFNQLKEKFDEFEKVFIGDTYAFQQEWPFP